MYRHACRHVYIDIVVSHPLAICHGTIGHMPRHHCGHMPRHHWPYATAPLESSHRDGQKDFRLVHSCALGMPSAMPMRRGTSIQRGIKRVTSQKRDLLLEPNRLLRTAKLEIDEAQLANGLRNPILPVGLEKSCCYKCRVGSPINNTVGRCS